jgi:hypothetical protein
VDKKILKKTTKLWTQAVEEELVEDIEADVVIGAHYAQLALDGTVELTESGAVKVEAALEALSELIGDDE